MYALPQVSLKWYLKIPPFVYSPRFIQDGAFGNERFGVQLPNKKVAEIYGLW